MGRTIDAALLAAIQNETILPIILVRLEYESGDINVHNGIGDIVFDGAGFQGIGNLGSVSASPETSDGSVNFIELTLSGVQSSLLSVQLNEHYQGRRCTIWYGLFNNSTHELITPTIVFRGIMDNSVINLGSIGSISLRVNNRMAEWDRTKLRRYTDTEQQNAFPGDNGLKFIQGLAETKVIWGR